MKGWDIVGYTYDADNYCPDCIVGEVLSRNTNLHSTRLDYIDTEHDLARLANLLGVDRMDEATFDSGDFPKVIFASSLEEDDLCAKCGAEL